VLSKDRFRNLAGGAATALGSPKLFAANVCLIALWLISGPFFHFSDTWQLVVNTATTIVTYLAVFLIQNTQNRDTKALQLKLDELILSMEGARNRLVRVEELSDEELELLQKQFERLRRLSTAGAIDAVKAVAAEREAPGGAPEPKPS
jgi:low affinity Fe/Cu permease